MGNKVKYRDDILKLHAAGLSAREIEKQLGCCHQLIYYYTKPGVKKRYEQQATKRKRHANQQIKLLHGGKCRVCGYDRCLPALDFHHVDPSQKKGTVQSFMNVGRLEDARKEANKCILVCSNCHREHHSGILSLDGIAPFVDNMDKETMSLKKIVPGREIISTI